METGSDPEQDGNHPPRGVDDRPGIDADDGRLERLERAGVIKRGIAPPPVDLISRPGPALHPGVSVVDAVLEERREGW